MICPSPIVVAVCYYQCSSFTFADYIYMLIWHFLSSLLLLRRLRQLVVGGAGSVVCTTIGLFVFTSICAALIGCLVSILFSPLYVLNDGEGKIIDPDVRIGCSLDAYGDPQSFLTQQADGSVVCVDNGGSGNDTVFVMDDINEYFQKSAAASGPAKLSISEGLYEVRHSMICFRAYCYYSRDLKANGTSVLNLVLFLILQSLFMQLIGTNMLGLFTSGVSKNSECSLTLTLS